jgi:hypothetical protein
LQINELSRAAVIAIFPWNTFSNAKPNPNATPKEHRNPLALARYCLSLRNSVKFESRAAPARYLGVSRARITQVVNRLRVTRMREHR